MPRQARKKSSTGIYHIILRGINRQVVFQDKEDNYRFLQTIKRYKEISKFELFAYCLMNNHVHLLLRVGEEPLEQVMRRICGSYVYWYNVKYQRIGNLFQDRFKSEAVEDDQYFITVLRYIHQNPLNAGITDKIEAYPWCSMTEYLHGLELIDADLTLKLFHSDRSKAIILLREFCEIENNDHCLEFEDHLRLSDSEAMKLIVEVCKVKDSSELQNLDKDSRNRYIKEIKEKYPLSIRQIERLTGLNRGVILKA